MPKSTAPVKNRFRWRSDGREPTKPGEYKHEGYFLSFADVNVAQITYDDGRLAITLRPDRPMFKCTAFHPVEGIITAINFVTLERAKEWAVAYCKYGSAVAMKPDWMKNAEEAAGPNDAANTQRALRAMDAAPTVQMRGDEDEDENGDEEEE